MAAEVDMCGFVVSVGKPLAKSNIENALQSIKHRGPDDIGIWQSEDQKISFGHTRLSIIDLDGGKQPLTNRDQSLVAVVNGEFYGYETIKEQVLKDYPFKTQSDSEIILGLYERFGVLALNYLRGEFAFVLWDKRNKLIFAARDYFGIKPLFYQEHRDGISFASEAKAFPHLGYPLTFDEESFYHTLNLFPQPKQSLFKDVYQILPAHYLIKSYGNPSHHEQSYWDFNYPKKEQFAHISEQEAAQGLRDVLSEAVRLRLRADVPVGCYLSGGIDSCTALGIAQTMSQKPIEAFCLTFDDDDYNEAQQAHEMAAMVGAHYHPIPITQKDIAMGFEDAVFHGERFLVNGHAVAKFLLSRAVNNAGIKVVLTGEGSDEIFGGYAHFRQDLILYGETAFEHEKEQLLEQLRLTNKVSRGLLLNDDINPFEQALINQIGFMPGFMRGFGQVAPKMKELFINDIDAHFRERNLMLTALSHLDIAGQVIGRDCLSKSLYLWSKLVLPYYLLTVLGDRMEMAHSVEGRLPFLDHKLVEYVVSLPSNLKINGMTEKYILRKAAQPFITKTIFERQKHPFLAPPSLLSQPQNPMEELINDTLRGNDMKNMPFIDQMKVTKLLDIVPQIPEEQKSGLDSVLLILLSACLLNKRIAQ